MKCKLRFLIQLGIKKVKYDIIKYNNKLIDQYAMGNFFNDIKISNLSLLKVKCISKDEII